jgi:hypothetical protein
MSPGAVLVGVVDSGAGPAQVARLHAARRFAMAGDGEAVDEFADVVDRVGHGTRCVEIILEHGGTTVAVAVAQVFEARATTTPQFVAAGIDWLVGEGARIVSMSLGLAHDRAVLRDACERAHARGTILVAATPARGAAAYPAAYPGVLAVTGDARCTLGEVSDLCGCMAEFGTFVGDPQARGTAGAVAGASIATAHFTVLVARHVEAVPDADLEAVRAHFRGIARYRGPERRGQGRGDG